MCAPPVRYEKRARRNDDDDFYIKKRRLIRGNRRGKTHAHTRFPGILPTACGNRLREVADDGGSREKRKVEETDAREIWCWTEVVALC